MILGQGIIGYQKLNMDMYIMFITMDIVNWWLLNGEKLGMENSWNFIWQKFFIQQKIYYIIINIQIKLKEK